MELEQIFYTLAALFGLAAIIYFAWEYLEILPRITKTILLFLLTFLFFMIADTLRSDETNSRGTKASKKVKA